MNYRVISIDGEAAEKVRSTMTSPFGKLPASLSVATGYGPCRSCLRTFRQGEEERVYITYDPFAGRSDLPLPGPVFIHAQDCEPYAGEGFPQTLLSIPMIFEGYGERSRLVASEAADATSLNEQIGRILERDDVEAIHIRNAEAGCFIARIEPA
jgi:hypothetical protein